ncbi:hypothetical protein LTR53_000722 [Teratosphaeriaceae sp. CCFEE 6253]|nr:hypothetical protein LTR53_000722 [Teratosphaeriaceae sp. CCFEE 6253]
MSITPIIAQQRLDSRGKPTIQVTLRTSRGIFRSTVPSGASNGDYEAVELRDSDPKVSNGQGVTKAVHSLEQILAPKILDWDLNPAHVLARVEQLTIDADGTPDKSKLGANVILAVSTGLGDEGGFALRVRHPHETLDLIVEAIDRAGYTGKVKISIDSASQSFRREGGYDLGFKTNKSQILDPEQLADLYHELLVKYSIVLLEDPLGQDDWESLTKSRSQLQVELVGHDLLATNKQGI